MKGICASGPETEGRISRLTDFGRGQIEKVAKSLAPKKVSVIYASPYTRTRETAEMIAQATGAKVVTDARLSELNVGVYNWKSILEYNSFFKNHDERYTHAPEGAETLTDVRRRMVQCIREINARHTNEHIVMVSHGDPLWMLVTAIAYDGSTPPYLEVGEARSVKVLGAPYNDDGEIDLHRPYVDAIEIECPKCDGRMHRVKEVADVWFDSGAMPFASQGYPRQKRIDFPADYICEGLDQTRGWFYTLLAVSTLVGKGTPYKNVISLGLILDKAGRKMSKSLGNVVEPWAVINTYGVDVVRWYFYTVNPPAEPKLFNEADVRTVANNFFTPLYNSFVFLNTYGGNAKRTTTESKNVLDWWVIVRLRETVATATDSLEKYDVGTAAREIERFVGDLSRWYIRRSRRRFQKPESGDDYDAACETLKYVLKETSKLVAPFTPFFAEALYRSFDGGELSVHCDEWPFGKIGKDEKKLIAQMEVARSAASLGLAKRAELGIKVRQPLASCTLRDVTLRRKDELLALLKDEVNVKEIFFDAKLIEDIAFDINITPELREEGILREFVRTVQGLRQDAGYRPSDIIALFADVRSARAVLAKNEAVLKKEIGARAIEWKRTDKFDAELSTKFEGEEIWLAVRKV